MRDRQGGGGGGGTDTTASSRKTRMLISNNHTINFIHLLEDGPNFTNNTLISFSSTDMLIRQEIVSQQWSVSQSLNYTVHETCIPKVSKSS